ncbi:MAG: hypothetical protein HY461_02370 [Parcubacteria group bacterium]|nr:hypothetical protein [Parcubacteria group bacterium]
MGQHDTIWNYLIQAAQTQTLGHALLFVGPRHVGKAELAQEFAKVWLCQPESSASMFAPATTAGARSSGAAAKPCSACTSCQSFARGLHPDVLTLALGEDEHQIPIKSMRVFLSALQQSPLVSPRKIGIIHGAEALNLASANAFLKTLEEASASTKLILLADNPQHLLATIRSRCQIIEFSHPAGAHKQPLASERGEPEDYELFVSLCSLTPGQRLAAVESLFGEKKGHATSKDVWRERLATWQKAARDMLCVRLGLNDAIPARHEALPAPFQQPGNYQQAIDALQKIRSEINGNINIRAHIEAFLISMV